MILAFCFAFYLDFQATFGPTEKALAKEEREAPSDLNQFGKAEKDVIGNGAGNRDSQKLKDAGSPAIGEAQSAGRNPKEAVHENVQGEKEGKLGKGEKGLLGEVEEKLRPNVVEKNHDQLQKKR